MKRRKPRKPTKKQGFRVEVVSMDELPKETLEDVIDNVRIDLVGEWSKQEAHRQALLNCNLGYEDEADIRDELIFRYWEEKEETAVRSFNSWLQRYRR